MRPIVSAGPAIVIQARAAASGAPLRNDTKPRLQYPALASLHMGGSLGVWSSKPAGEVQR